ncbi:hypothetical protein [Aquimarina sp. 2201CG14-23]|uniref:hypothetical protein n=1 Tax=Aquimarina mycalae TaxID=3040073 RepID=UPI002477E3C2|nr:hypothetical protein [Aquimarina sp. 2201CG14-23]MDH7444664.1 hypothetical protein [Aquimarina sp. 2201CG14-23]
MNILTHKELTQDDLDMYFYYRKHGINKGYFLRYFDQLKNCRTAFEAYNNVNDEYFDLFGEYKYSSIRSFRNSLKIYLAK